MRGLWEWLKGVGKFILENADVFFSMTVALGVIVALVVGHPSSEVIDGAILGLLGTTALALLRSRSGNNELHEIRQMADDAISDRPYQVVRQLNEWDLKDRDNTTMRMTQQIRFTRNDVSTIAHWSSGPGKIERYAAKWKRDEETAWTDALKIHEFPIHTGEKVIYSLDEEHCRGDTLDWCIERDAVGRFPGPHEGVSLEARTKSDHPRIMRVTWPPGVVPKNVAMRFKGRAATILTPKRKNGRLRIEEKISQLEVGETVEITWTW